MPKGNFYKDRSKQKIAVVGLGYVGLPLSLLFLEKGFEVIGIDLDRNKIEKLENSISYLSDIEDKSIESAFSTKRLIFTHDYNMVSLADAIIICVPTPLTPDHKPELTFLQKVGSELSTRIQKGQLVILESSTYPGTTQDVLQPLLEKSGLRVGKEIFLAYSPERIDPGNKDFPAHKVPKILSGVSEECKMRAQKLYSQVFACVVMVSSPKTAELTKLVENCYRFINISFINELAMICDSMNIDLWEVIDAAKTKPYGFAPFYPGPGVGGHCIPVDPLYLSWKAKQHGTHSSFIELADRVNQQMPQYIVEKIKNYLCPLKSKINVLIYGVAYKRDVNDVRESSALEIIKVLQQNGINVTFHDPYIPSLQIGNESMKSVDLTVEALEQSDMVVILTDHSNIPIKKILEYAPFVFDTRNATKGYIGKAKVFRLGGRNQ